MVYFKVLRNSMPKGEDKKLTDEFNIKLKLLIQSSFLVIVILTVGSAWNFMPNEELILFAQSIGGFVGIVCVMTVMYLNHKNNKEVEEYRESLTKT